MKRILLVEDEKSTSDLVKAFLERHNFEVVVAFDGEEALAKLKKTPDLIILDLMLPKLDGREVLQKIRVNPKTRDIPVICFTARTESQSIFEAMEEGSFDYLIKPVDNNELLDTIFRAFHLADFKRNMQ